MGIGKKIFWILLYATVLVGYKNDEFVDLGRQLVAVVPVTDLRAVIPVQIQKSVLQSSNLDFETAIFGYLLCAKNCYKMVRDYVVYKRWLKYLSHDEFVIKFNHLVLLEKQILHIQDLLHAATHGTFPEQLRSRISLAQSSLPYPYDRIIDQCVTKYGKTNFDEQGRLIWNEQDSSELSFKKFYKKVPQDFRALARYAKTTLKNVKHDGAFQIADKSKNEFNQTLLDMICAEIDENFPLLKKLCRNYHDSLIEKLYKYYLDQNLKKYPTGASNEVVFFTELYCKEMLSWLCVDGIGSDAVCDKIYELLAQENVLELPANPDYKFLLLRRFFDMSDTIKVQKELFLPCGILKKYESHASVKNVIFLQDALFCKAVNFALVIGDKELDISTQRFCKCMIQYVLSACKVQSNEEHERCKNKIVVLYEALSYKTMQPLGDYFCMN